MAERPNNYSKYPIRVQARDLRENNAGRARKTKKNREKIAEKSAKNLDTTVFGRGKSRTSIAPLFSTFPEICLHTWRVSSLIISSPYYACLRICICVYIYVFSTLAWRF